MFNEKYTIYILNERLSYSFSFDQIKLISNKYIVQILSAINQKRNGGCELTFQCKHSKGKTQYFSLYET